MTEPTVQIGSTCRTTERLTKLLRLFFLSRITDSESETFLEDDIKKTYSQRELLK
jgi:hypothetical protein